MVASVVDRLTGHAELIGDLRDWFAGLDQIQNLATKLCRVAPQHDDLLMVDVPEIQLPDPRVPRGRPS